MPQARTKRVCRPVRRARRKPENHSPWAASRPKPARSPSGPCQPSGPRTRLGCVTGRAVVSTCRQASSGRCRTTGGRRCSKAPQSQRTRRLNTLWVGRRGKKWLKSRRTSARKPRSPGRPSRWRTRAIVNTSASEQTGAGLGRDRNEAGLEGIVDQHVDMDKQVANWHYWDGDLLGERRASFSPQGGCCTSTHITRLG